MSATPIANVSLRSVAPPAVIDVSEVIERQRLRWFVVRLILVSWLVTFFDGYDLNVIAFAAPYMKETYALDTSMLSYVFSSGIAGTFCGGFLFGFVGDRIGRRPTIIAATSLFGVLTLLLAAASNYWQFLILRFLNGLALGGALPLIWALSIEYVATRYRATIVTLIMLGYGIGVSAAGPISVALTPLFGWRSVFVFGGLASLVSALLLWRALPESLRFLAARRHDHARMARIVRRLAPERTDLDGARFTMSGLESNTRPWWDARALFEGPLNLITPLLWLSYATSSITTFFFTTWGPLVFEALGFSRETAAYASSMNSLAGAVGALALMRFTDRIGPISVAVMPAIAVPFLLFIGLASVTHAQFLVMMGVLYVFLGGSHYGIISIGGTFYPTTHRALGSGWLAAVGKIGSIAGPWVGAWILSSHIPVKHTFAILAVAPAVFALATLTIGLLEWRGRVRAAA
ncbi:MAG TPA: MFS transporter [Steroidobacteraceae bacterium]|nr:MFS transporter [Steroidobacteraceae bacterium]